MSEHDPSLNHHYAMESLREACADAVGSLASQAVAQAEAFTHHSGVTMRDNLLHDAHAITHDAGVTKPKQIVEEAGAITRYDVEVTSLGEDLGKDEEPIKGPVADQAYALLRTVNLTAPGAKLSKADLAYNYALRKIQNTKDLEDINRKYGA